ncbi:hypothetical protein [Candidatus Uabimicrobium sp. HlEnr_7]|uniref:hypothetical protein n=1 Tax=Candidatus Uabimicrobium helgolandensis TaxID=3095367 RepID=UPI00355736F4
MKKDKNIVIKKIISYTRYWLESIALNKLIFFHLWWLLLFIIPTTAQEQNLEEKVNKLEKQVETLINEVTNLHEIIQTQQKVIEQNAKKIVHPKTLPYEEIIKELEEDLSYNKDQTYYLNVLNSHLQIGGYSELIFIAEEKKDPQFIFSRFALRVRSSIQDWLSFQAEIAIEDDIDLEISYAHFNILLSPIFNIKAGLIIVPFGQYNSFYPPPGNELTSIPLVNEFLIPTVWSEPGVSVYGQIDNFSPLTLTYEFLISNGLGEGGFDIVEGNRDARQDFNVDNNADKQFSGRIGFIPHLSLLPFGFVFGLSGVIGEFDDNGNNQYAGLAVDGNLRIGSFSLIGDHNYIEISGEYAQFDIESDDRIVQLFPQIASFMSGHYIQVDYFFFPEQWRGQSFLFNDQSQFALSLRYDHLQFDSSQKGASELDDQSIYTIGINFRPVEKAVFKVEYNHIRKFVNGSEDWIGRLQASFSTYF